MKHRLGLYDYLMHRVAVHEKNTRERPRGTSNRIAKRWMPFTKVLMNWVLRIPERPATVRSGISCFREMGTKRRRGQRLANGEPEGALLFGHGAPFSESRRGILAWLGQRRSRKRVYPCWAMVAPPLSPGRRGRFGLDPAPQLRQCSAGLIDSISLQVDPQNADWRYGGSFRTSAILHRPSSIVHSITSQLVQTPFSLCHPKS